MSKKKKNSGGVEYPIEFMELTLNLSIKDKGTFRKRWISPMKPLRISGEALKDTARVKDFLLDMGKNWEIQIENFIKELE